MDEKKRSTKILSHNIIFVASGMKKPLVRVYKHPKEAVTNSVHDQDNSEELPLVIPEDAAAVLTDNVKKLVRQKHSQLLHKIPRNNERITKKEMSKQKCIRHTDAKQPKPPITAGSINMNKPTNKRINDLTDLHVRLESIGKELDSLQEDSLKKISYRKKQIKTTKRLNQSEKYKQQSPMVHQDYEVYTARLPIYNAEYYTEGSNRSLPGHTSCRMFETLGSPNLTSKTGQELLRKNETSKNDIKDSVRRIRDELSTWKNTTVPIENTCVCGTSEINTMESVIQSPLQLDSQLASSSDYKGTSEGSVQKQVYDTICNTEQLSYMGGYFLKKKECEVRSEDYTNLGNTRR